MDAPEQQPTGTARAQTLIRSVVHAGGRRNAVILALFAILVVASGRTGSPADTHRPAAQPAADRPVAPLPLHQAPESAPEATAVENLLSRFDVLIRLLEIRAVQNGHASPSLIELRALRQSVFEASARAVASEDSTPMRPR